MDKITDTRRFLESIMQIKDIKMGGAMAGIIGSSDINSDIVNNLKKSTVIFAQEYCKSEPNQAELTQVAEQVSGYLQTLQLTNTLSESTTAGFIDELEKLMDKASN